MIDYILKRSSRKTVAIHIREGLVEVRAPLRMPKSNIDRFVKEKDDWIAEKLKKQSEEIAQRKDFTLTYGDCLFYRGKQYPIGARQGDRMGFDNECFYMPPNLAPKQIKYACIQIYRLLAKRDLTARTLEFAQRMNVKPDAVRINSAKTRWGSCSSKKSVNFSWRLIMADDDVIDYVIVHELSHITELNHSERFWALVRSVLPDYAERKARLKELQRRLTCEDWEELQL